MSGMGALLLRGKLLLVDAVRWILVEHTQEIRPTVRQAPAGQHIHAGAAGQRTVMRVADRDFLAALLPQDEAGEGVDALVRRREGVVGGQRGRAVRAGEMDRA